MKMRPRVNLDEFVMVNRSVQTTQNIGHLSRFHEEQRFDARNPQMECKAHLSQNVAHSSMYGSNVTPQNWYVTNHKCHTSNAEENQRNRNPGKIKQNHKGVDTHDVDSSCRYQSETTDEKTTYSSCCSKLYLWCAKLCHRKKKCSKHVGKSRRLWQRIRKGRKKCEKPKTTIIDTSTKCQEPISPSIAKLKKNDNQELMKVINDTVDDRKQKEKKRERRKKEKDKRERREKKGKVKRCEHEEEILYARDEDRIARNHVFKKPLLLPPLPTDFTKSCCYLCTQNTLAIAAAITRPEQFDKSVQVSAHKLCVTSPELDKSCSPLLVRTSIKVKTRETSTLCPSTNETRHKEMRMKKRKFGMFPRLTRTMCPVGRHAACETDKMILRCNDNAGKREPRNEKCCRRKNI